MEDAMLRLKSFLFEYFQNSVVYWGLDKEPCEIPENGYAIFIKAESACWFDVQIKTISKKDIDSIIYWMVKDMPCHGMKPWGYCSTLSRLDGDILINARRLSVSVSDNGMQTL
jgi:hypothetical protein